LLIRGDYCSNVISSRQKQYLIFIFGFKKRVSALFLCI
jgi:hypothetical protein